MKKILTALFLLSSMGMMAQETYQNAELMTEDLNGTARYVGMGGAMNALGADISVINSNPAGIGLFRKTQASVTLGGSHVLNGGNVTDADNKTFMDFNQAGFVLTFPTADGSGSFVNFGFNYRKSNNFNQIISAIRNLDCTASQNQVSYDKNYQYYERYKKEFTYLNDRTGDIETINDIGSQVDYLYYNTLLPEFNGTDYQFWSNPACDFLLDRNRKGYIGEYSFNISGNIQDRCYLGLTVGVKDVHYTNSTLYTEGLVDSKDQHIGDVTLDDVRKITGQGVNLSAGVIFRPVEASPFRIGLSVSTPTYYDLTTENSTYLYNDTEYGAYKVKGIGEVYDYMMVTPWQLGLSLGTTFGSKLAIGASYDYADYSSSKSKIKDGTDYDWWTGEYYTHASNDDVMNYHTEKSLKSVHTVKVGAEIRPVPEVAVRLGYNYVSPMYKKDAFRNVSLDSPGTYYSSTTDYTNWEATNRFTAGLGFNIDNFGLDLAYQYSTTKGDFHPFENFNDENWTPCTQLKNDRHQLLCTLSMRF